MTARIEAASRNWCDLRRERPALPGRHRCVRGDTRDAFLATSRGSGPAGCSWEFPPTGRCFASPASSTDLALRIMAVADPTIYGPPLVVDLRTRFDELRHDPALLKQEWAAHVVAFGRRDREAAVDLLVSLLQDPAAVGSSSQMTLFRALGQVADHDPGGIVERQFRRVMQDKDAGTPVCEVYLRLRALRRHNRLARSDRGARTAGHGRPVYCPLLAANVSLTDAERRTYFAGTSPNSS